MSLLLIKQREIEKKKRYFFLTITSVGVISSIFFTIWLGLPIISFSIYLGINWFKFRCKYGMRF